MFTPAPKLWEGADFSSASGDFKALGAFFCNSAALSFLPESRTVNRAPVYHILWSRGFRATTISGRGFNLFKPLRRHFEATPFCRRAPARRDPGDRARCERLFRQSPNERRQRCLSSRRNPTRHCERSEAIQGRITRPLDCFVARAPRNDGRGRSLRPFSHLRRTDDKSQSH